MAWQELPSRLYMACQSLEEARGSIVTVAADQ
jgi:hypothetical protein